MSISVQADDFDIGHEISKLTEGRTDIGAIVTFTGLVRDMAGGKKITDMELEHYPGMTEKALADIEAKTKEISQLNTKVLIKQKDLLEMNSHVERYKIQIESLNEKISFLEC